MAQRGKLVELAIGAGVLTEETDRGAFGRYKDGDKIRFRQLLAEKLGGWVLSSLGSAPGDINNDDNQFTGLSANYSVGASTIPLESPITVLDGAPIWLFGTSLTGAWGTRTIDDAGAVEGAFIFDLDAVVVAPLGAAFVIEYPAEFLGVTSEVQLQADWEGLDGATSYTELSQNLASATFSGGAEIDTAQFNSGASALRLVRSSNSFASFPDIPAFDFGTKEWTLEGFVRFASLPPIGTTTDPGYCLASIWDDGNVEQIRYEIIRDAFGTRVKLAGNGGWSEQSTISGGVALNTWFHWAVTRDSAGDIRAYFNATFETSDFGSAPADMGGSAAPLRIGQSDGIGRTDFMDGWIDDVRLTIGTALYTGTGSITPDSTPHPAPTSGPGGVAIVGGGTVGSEILILGSPVNTYLKAGTIVRIDLDGGGVHFTKTVTDISAGSSTITIQDPLPDIPASGLPLNLYCRTSDIVDDATELSYVLRFLAAAIPSIKIVRLTESLPCDADGHNVNIFEFQLVTADGDQTSTSNLAITPVTLIANIDGSGFPNSVTVAPAFQSEQTCYLGFARALHDWVDLDGERWLAIGTDLKLYLVNQGTLFDITPLRQTGILTDPFDTVVSDQTVTVNDVAHGGAVGNFVRFTGAAIVGGLNLNDEFQIATVIDANTYTIEADFPAIATASGGGTVLFEYDIDIGAAGNVTVQGWGTGPYGGGLYGFGSTVTGIAVKLRIWSLDNFGEDLLAAPSSGSLYHWDLSLGTTSRAVLVEEAPATIQYMLVSPEARHVITFGAGTGSALAPGDPDKLLIRWSSSENFEDWVPTSINTAGDLRLDKGSEIVTAIESRGDIIIMTDESLHAMQFIGGALVFSLRHLGQSVAIIGPNAGVDVNGIVFFMGEDDFLIYDGVLRVLDCDVRNQVFDDLNGDQGFKVFSSVNKLFTEVWWLYPQAASETNTRYVKFNYKDLVWDFGTLERTAFHDSSAFLLAPYATQGGKLFLHETGVDDADEDGVLHAMISFIETYDAEIEAGGEHIMHISRMIPDFKNMTGSVDLTMTGRQYPQDSTDEVIKGPFTILPGTDRIDMRMRARQISFRIDSDALGDDWRMGTWRANVRPHGRRGGG